MWQLYEIFKILQIQKRIVSAETIRGNTIYRNFIQKQRKSLVIFLFFLISCNVVFTIQFFSRSKDRESQGLALLK